MRIVSGKCCGILIETDDVTLEDVTVGWSDETGTTVFRPEGEEKPTIDDYISDLPPLVEEFYNGENFDWEKGTYRFLEIRTTGKIIVNGHVNANGQGFIGGGSGSNGQIYSDNGVGGYLGIAKNGDPMNDKSFSEIIAGDLDGKYKTEKQRNRVYPGSGGSGGKPVGGGGSGGSASGGSGGGFVRLIANRGIEFNENSKVTCVGVRDGKNGGDGQFHQNDANCKFSLSECKGTILRGQSSKTHPSWAHGGNATKNERGKGSSKGGGKAPCCSGFALGLRAWDKCGCGNWEHDSNCKGYSCKGGGCCCKDLEDKSLSPSGGCASGKDGYGGGGGGLLLRSFGPISFTKANIDLTGYNGPYHGGTLKVFHCGLVPDWIFLDAERVSASDELKQKVGGFYNELLYAGYCIENNSLKVSSLTSVATQYPAGEEVFELSFGEGDAFVPLGIEVTHSGYEIYRYLSGDLVDSASGREEAPDFSSPEWTLVETIPYITQDILGPTSPPPRPFNGQVLTDSLGRPWEYNDGTQNDGKMPGWYMDVETAKEDGTYFSVNWKDEKIYSYLMAVKNKTYDEAVKMVQNILYAKKQIWYMVKPKFTVANVLLSPDCDEKTIHPEVTYPKMEVYLSDISSTPYEFSDPHIKGRIEGSDLQHPDKYYDEKRNSDENYASGYDDFTIALNTPTYWGSFHISNWGVDWDLTTPSPANIFNFNSMTVSANTPRKPETIINRLYTYENPTLFGRTVLTPKTPDGDGYKVISISANFNKNCYDNTKSNQLVGNAKCTIIEREPTPVFHLVPKDSPVVEPPRNGVSYPVGDNNVDKYHIRFLDRDSFIFKRSVYGFAHSLSVKFFDESIARTYPISSWKIDFDVDVDDAVANYEKIITDTTKTSADDQHIRPDVAPYDVDVLSAKIYELPGIYYPTLTIAASTTNTSNDLSAINTVKVYPLPPTAQFTSMASSNFEGISAFVPIYFKATDLSLDNDYYPITVWDWKIYDNFDRTALDSVVTKYEPENILEYNWRWHTDNYDPDHLTVDPSLNNLCLNVRTSAFGWRGRTDESGIDGLKSVYDTPVFSESEICKHLYLYEKPPVAGIVVPEAVTYTFDFDDDDPNFEEKPAKQDNDEIIGYAPYLNIQFQDASIPKSYPISSYVWNFGDYYNEESNIYKVELPVGSRSSGWDNVFPLDHGPEGDDNYPEWNTDATAHTINHIYTLPGEYKVTLTVQASSTSTTSIAEFTVRVMENPPVCGYSMSLDGKSWGQNIDGESPLTVYFTPTATKTGSFPIGKLIWDFGDGTPPLVIDRYVDNYQNLPYGSDPRWYNNGIISHTYERQLKDQPSVFTVSLSVVADKSNTVVFCREYEIGPIRLPAFTSDGDHVHLIKNRSLELKDENLYVLQRESDKSVYNIMLSSG